VATFGGAIDTCGCEIAIRELQTHPLHTTPPYRVSVIERRPVFVQVDLSWGLNGHIRLVYYKK